MGHKIDAIKEDDKVCFTTWDDGTLEEGDWAYYVSSCVVFGRAKLIEDRKITEEKIRTLAMKYYPTAKEAEEEIAKYLKAVQMVAIEIEHISGKRVHEK
jgi:nitroimidazol reductase NimA-like FMN-containing flavoprotein (pyridoxamine 5'-phosphate oxidase superfamily)